MTAASLNEILAERGDIPQPLFAPPGDRPRVGSLFSGFGGLDLAVQAVLGGSLAWHCEIDPGACAILDYHWPDVPNLGDISEVDWDSVEPVDIVTGGFPCTDVSSAGRQEGLRPGTRSGLWAQMAFAIEKLRPRLVVIENVRGLLSARGAPKTDELIAAEDRRDAAGRALGLVESKLSKAIREGKTDHVGWHRRDRVRLLRRVKRAVDACKRADARIVRAIGTVLGDLARLGFHAEWVGVRASDFGAPHQRFRIFILAWPVADAVGGELQRRGVAGVVGGAQAAESGEGHQRERAGNPAGDGGAAAADPDSSGCEGPGDGESAGRPASAGGGAGLGVVADSAGSGRGPLVAVDVAGDGGASVCAGETEPGRRDSAVVADSDGVGSVRGGGSRGGRPGSEDHDRAAANSEGFGRGEGWPESAGLVGGPDAAVGDYGAAADAPGAERRGPEREDPGAAVGSAAEPGERVGAVAWGSYGPAIRRWELILGRAAPAPTVTGARGGQQLSPRFVEWMQGLPEGHVTAVPGLSRNDQLRALGNGVVPLQAAAAIGMLLAASAWSGVAA